MAGSGPIPSGRVVGGLWTLGQELGAGGVSTTFRATDAAGEAFVVRVFDPALSARAEVMAALRRAGERTNRLPANETAHVVDSGIDTQTRAPYSVVPFVATPSLAGRGPTALDTVVAFLRSMARTLDSMHAMRGAHLGLKPTNVFVGAAPDDVRVVDFGIASARAALSTAEGRAAATPWIAPEQLRVESEAAAPADVFSSALVAFYALTGHPLWIACGAKTLDVDAVAKELKAPAPKVTVRAKAVGVTLPEALDAVMLRALATAPSDRFLSVGAFASAFAEAARTKTHATEVLVAIPPPRAAPARASQPQPQPKLQLQVKPQTSAKPPVAPSKPPPEPIDVTDDAVREVSVADAPAFLPLPEIAPTKLEPPAPPSVALAADDEGAPPVGDAGLFAPPSLFVRAKGLARDAGKKIAATAVMLFERAKDLQRANPKAAIVYAVLGAATLLLVVGGIIAMCSKSHRSSTEDASTEPTPRRTLANSVPTSSATTPSSSATQDLAALAPPPAPPPTTASAAASGATDSSTLGSITIQCAPVPCTWARLDGKSQPNATGPFSVSVGKHTVLVGALGYQSASDGADVVAGTTTDKTFTLQIAPAKTATTTTATNKPTTTKKEPCSKFFHTCK